MVGFGTGEIEAMDSVDGASYPTHNTFKENIFKKPNGYMFFDLAKGIEGLKIVHNKGYVRIDSHKDYQSEATAIRESASIIYNLELITHDELLSVNELIRNTNNKGAINIAKNVLKGMIIENVKKSLV